MSVNIIFKHLKKIIKTSIFIFLILFIIASVIVKPKIYTFYKEAKRLIEKPIDKEELVYKEEKAVTIKDRNDITLTTLYPEFGGKYKEAKYEDIPRVLINAVISAEDKNFFKHNGMDYTSIAKAFLRNIKAGRIVSGGSTITQQLAKSFNKRERNYKNKLYEAVEALRLEKHLTKEEIITIYLNRVFFGNNLYGVYAASENYFKKDLKDINIEEAALLASIIKSGTKFNPYKESEKLEERKKYVLSQMKENEYITDDEYKKSLESYVVFNKTENIFKSPHFVMYVKESIKKLNYNDVTEIKTTLDYKLQEEAIKVILNSTKALESFNVRNTSCVILNAKTGEILSMIGSLNYFDTETSGAVNGATALRQPGSTLKPFLYAYLFENGETPASVIGDVKTYISSPGGDYIPDNFDKKFRGPVTIRDALANSLNVPAVRWLSLYRLDEFQNILLKAGLSTIKKNPDFYGYSLVLGSAEVRLIDLASAYTTFSKDGYFIDSSSIINLKKANGETITLPKKKSKKIFSEESSYLITSILTDKRARLGAFPNLRGVVYPFSIAIKTGTSKGYRDAWAVGYTKDYIVAIWLGDFKGSEMVNITGGNGAVPVLYDLFTMLNKEQKETKWTKPKTIETREICIISGKLKGEFCNESRNEVFARGHIPEEICDVHRLFIKYNDDKTIEKKVFMKLQKEYALWMKERKIETPSDDWVDTFKYENTKLSYDINNELNYKKINTENEINYNSDIQSYSSEKIYKSSFIKSAKTERVTITSPTQNALYRIDNNLPLDYQKISINASMPENTKEAYLYCNNELIASHYDIKKGNIKWTLKQGEYSFFVVAILESEDEVKSVAINISVQ